MIGPITETAIVKFTSDWCSVCKSMIPLEKEFADKHNINIIYVDVDSDGGRQAALDSSVKALPTYIYLKEGKYQRSHIGGMNEEQFEDLITPIN